MTYDYKKMIDKNIPGLICVDIASKKHQITLRLIALCILSFRSKFNRYPSKFHYYEKFDWEVKAEIMTSPIYRAFTDIITAFGLNLVEYYGDPKNLVNYYNSKSSVKLAVNNEDRENIVFVSDGEDSVMGIF